MILMKKIELMKISNYNLDKVYTDMIPTVKTEINNND